MMRDRAEVRERLETAAGWFCWLLVYGGGVSCCVLFFIFHGHAGHGHSFFKGQPPPPAAVIATAHTLVRHPATPGNSLHDSLAGSVFGFPCDVSHFFCIYAATVILSILIILLFFSFLRLSHIARSFTSSILNPKHGPTS